MTIVIGYGGSSHRLDQGRTPRDRVCRRHGRTSALDGNWNRNRVRTGRVPARLQARDTVQFRHLRSSGDIAGRRLEPPARPAPDHDRQVEDQGIRERVPRLARAGRRRDRLLGCAGLRPGPFAAHQLDAGAAPRPSSWGRATRLFDGLGVGAGPERPRQPPAIHVCAVHL